MTLIQQLKYNIDLMKRGKRQIIEKSNLFEGEAQPFQSPFPQQSNHNNQQTSFSAPNPINRESTIIKTHAPVAKVKQSNNPTEVVKESGDQEKKKRLEMLRQKYLKNNKEEKSQVPDSNKSHLANYKGQDTTSKSQLKKIENNYKKQEQRKFLFQQPSKEEISFNQDQKLLNGSKKDMQQPISQPSSNFIKIVGVPKPPIGASKRVVPPPPPTKPFTSSVSEVDVIQKQSTSEIIHKRQEERAVRPNSKLNDNFENLQFHPNNQNHTKFNTVSQSKKEDVLQLNLHQHIQQWLSIFQTEKVSSSSPAKMKLICSPLSSNPTFIEGVLLNFLLYNTKQYNQQQSSFIIQALENQPVPAITKAVLMIKCGSQLIQDQSCFKQNSGTLESLVQLKEIFLEAELNKFVAHFLKNVEYKEEDIPKLVQLNGKCSSLIELVQNYKFSSFNNIIQCLKQLKKRILRDGGDQICSIYYKLISILVNQVEDEKDLESILKEINEITYQNSYQAKKDLKLKIIEKIDRITNSNQAANHQSSRRQKQPLVKLEDVKNKSEKGSGVTNIFGFVNQTLKKFTNQIVQKQPEPSQKEEVKWDPVLNRYLVNGKIPDDQETNSKILQSQQNNEEKTSKKKVPPPPPKFGRKRQQSTKQKNSEEERPTQAAEEVNVSNNIYSQQQNEGNKSFPQRMGIKGINKKPKIQARYT